MKKELNFPLYLTYGDKVFSILEYITDGSRTYIDGKAYINSEQGIVCVYLKNPDKLKYGPLVPYFWKDEENKITYSELSPNTFKYFSLDNIADLSMESIDENTKEGETLYDEEIIMSINTSTSVFKPPINEDDDFLKKIVKQAILDKDIDVKVLENKLHKKNGLNNLKSALLGKTKMSTINFIVWCELLGIEFEIYVTDSGIDKMHPLPKTLHYTSSNDKLEKED